MLLHLVCSVKGKTTKDTHTHSRQYKCRFACGLPLVTLERQSQRQVVFVPATLPKAASIKNKRMRTEESEAEITLSALMKSPENSSQKYPV